MNLGRANYARNGEGGWGGGGVHTVVCSPLSFRDFFPELVAFLLNTTILETGTRSSRPTSGSNFIAFPDSLTTG